jgi:regulator of sigma D
MLTSVALNTDLLESLQELADLQGVEVGNMLDDVVRQYLQQSRREKIQHENEHFVRMHADLMKQYNGYHVAIHQGKLVDRDKDLDELVMRIKARFGRTPVLIALVMDKSSPTFTIRRPQLLYSP